MSELTRRLIMGAAVATAAAGPALAAEPRRRKNIAGLTMADPDVKALAKAIPLMRARRDALSWPNQNAIHAGYWAQHLTWRFLPWHRAQLIWFERIVARVSGYSKFAMPYWDWQSTPILPALFTDPRGPFYHPRRARGLATLDFVAERGPPTRGWARLLEDPFWVFGGGQTMAGAVETSGHGYVHVMVDGDMASTQTAALDPIFWFHHCNIDRVWATWQRGPMGQGAMDPAWLAETFSNFVDETGRPARALRTSDILTLGQPSGLMNYVYDRPYPSPVFSTALPPAPAGATRREVVGTETYVLSATANLGGKAGLRLALPPDLLARLSADAAGNLELSGLGRVRFSAEHVTGTDIAITIDRLTTSGVREAVAVSRLMPFGGGHGAGESHEHAMAFAVGPQLHDSGAEGAFLDIELVATPTWPQMDGGMAMPGLITALELELTVTEYAWT